MAKTKYPYEKAVNIPRLRKEILDSSITIALDYIYAAGVNTDVWMKAQLSATDQTALNTIVANHQNIPLPDATAVQTLDGKEWVHESSRPFGTITNFTSQGDATAPADSTVLSTAVGGGRLMKLHHVAGVDSSEQHVTFDLNVLENPTYIHEGYMMWKNAEFDTVSMGIIPTTTDTTAMSNTFFNIPPSAPYLLVPAAGDGSYNPVVDGTIGRFNLVEMPPSQDTGLRPDAYWKCPYDRNTHTFGDLTAAPAGDGTYNIFTAEVCLAKFVNEALVVGDGFLMLQSADIHAIGHGMRMRLCSHTDTSGGDHSWKAGFIMTLNREKTG